MHVKSAILVLEGKNGDQGSAKTKATKKNSKSAQYC